MTPSPRANRTRRSAADMRVELMRCAVDELADVGPERASLRSIARRVGISHQAVSYHFADRTALFTSVATDSWRRLHDRSADAVASVEVDAPAGAAVAEIGAAYVAFARSNRACFTLMFGSRLIDSKNMELLDARTRMWLLHSRTVAAAAARGWGRAVDSGVLAVTSWSLAHGLAVLEGESGESFPGDHRPEEILRLVNAAIVPPG